MIQDQRTTWETYASAWRSLDPADKQAALHASVAPSAQYRDPQVHTVGHQALLEYMLAFHQRVGSGQHHSYGADLEIYGPEYDAHSTRSVLHYAIPVRERASSGEGG